MIVRSVRARGAIVLSALSIALLLPLAVPAVASAAPATASSIICGVPSDGAGEGGVDMSATILGPQSDPCEPPPASGGSGSGAPGGGGPRGGSTGSQVGVSGAVETSTDTPAPASDEIDLGGVVHVGGLSSVGVPSINPLGGELVLSFTVRNVSQTTFDSDALFWMENPFGGRISERAVAIGDLKPGESRVVSADLPGVGQWAVLTAHATFMPPDQVEDTKLSPLTRDATVFALPWFFLLLLVLAVAGSATVHVLRQHASVRSVPLGAPA